MRKQKFYAIINKIIFSWQEEVSILIQIDIVDYDNLTSLGMRITKYVNSNLRDIVRVLMDILETDPEFDLDGFFPRDYLLRKPQECRNAVDELYEIICSKNIRDFIKLTCCAR